jgi:hypothetical protein
VVHWLRAFRHYLLGGGAPRQPGCWSDFDLQTDNQAITWLKTNRHLNKMYIRWLDEIEDFQSSTSMRRTFRARAIRRIPCLGTVAVSEAPARQRDRRRQRSPALIRSPTGDTDAESQQELFSRLGRDAPAPARLAAIRANWAATRCTAAAEFANVQRGAATTPPPLRGGGTDLFPPYPRMFVPLAGSELTLGTGTTTAPSPPTPFHDQLLSPTFVQRLAAEQTTDKLFGPIVRGVAVALGKLVHRFGTPIVDPARTPKGGPGGAFLLRCGLLYCRGLGEVDRLFVPAAAGRRQRPTYEGASARGVPRRPAGRSFRPSQDGHWYIASPSGSVKTATWPRMCARSRLVSALRQTTADHRRRGLLHLLPLPSRRGCVIEVDWIAGPAARGCRRRRAVGGGVQVRHDPKAQ